MIGLTDKWRISLMAMACLLAGCDSQLVGIKSYPERATMQPTDDPCIFIKRIPVRKFQRDGHYEEIQVEAMVDRCLLGGAEK